jgi:hypothetical protein
MLDPSPLSAGSDLHPPAWPIALVGFDGVVLVLAPGGGRQARRGWRGGGCPALASRACQPASSTLTWAQTHVPVRPGSSGLVPDALVGGPSRAEKGIRSPVDVVLLWSLRPWASRALGAVSWALPCRFERAD